LCISPTGRITHLAAYGVSEHSLCLEGYFYLIQAPDPQKGCCDPHYLVVTKWRSCCNYSSLHCSARTTSICLVFLKGFQARILLLSKVVFFPIGLVKKLGWPILFAQLSSFFPCFASAHDDCRILICMISCVCSRFFVSCATVR
jgi:hypothetical protein